MGCLCVSEVLLLLNTRHSPMEPLKIGSVMTSTLTRGLRLHLNSLSLSY